MSHSTNVYSLKAVREIKQTEREDYAYQAMILSMDKLELLEEMVRFQEERSRRGLLTVTMMIRGRYLFKALETSAETRELKLLTGSYRRHLDHELNDYIKKKAAGDEESIYAAE